MGSARVFGRPQGRAGQRGVRWGPRVSPGHLFLGSTSQGPILPATDADLNLWTVRALCSGETAQPRAVWELEDLIPPQIINTDCRGSGLPGERLGVGGPRLGEQGCGGGGGPAPTLFLTPSGHQASIPSAPPLSGVRNCRKGSRLLGTWWRVWGGAGLSYAPGSGASGDTDVDSLTVTTPPCGPQLLPV